MDSENESSTENEESYTIRIGKNLSQKLDRHFYILKYLKNKKVKKGQWVINAISEKLEREENLPPYELPKESYIHVQIPKQMADRINKIRQMRKTLKMSYSKTQWTEEAFVEMMAKEEAEMLPELPKETP